MPGVLRNNAHAGSNSASVGYTVSGGALSGDDWDLIFTGPNATATYTNQPARGAFSYQFSVGATVTDTKLEWQNFPASTTTYLRFYVYLPSLPSASFRFCELSDGTQAVWGFGCRSDGHVSIRDSANASMTISALSLPIGRWLRLEATIVSHASTGSCTVKLFTEADSPYPAEVMTSTNSFNTAPNGTGITTARFGIVGAAVNNYSYCMDDIELNDTGYAGPANPTMAMPLEACNTADFGTNGTVASSQNTGSSDNRYFQGFTQTGQISFSNAQAAHGTLSYLFQPVSGSNNVVTWRGLHTNAVALRFYVYLTAIPTDTEPLALGQVTTSGGAGFLQMAWAAVRSNGRMSVYDSTANSPIWTSAAPVAINTWYRVELLVVTGATASTGTVQAAYYLHDNPTAVESFNTATATLGTNPIGWVRLGKINPTTDSAPFYLDSIGMRQNASGLLGPFTAPPAQPPAVPGTIPHLGWGREA